MQTAIRSRVQSVLTVIALLLITALVIAAIVFAVQRALPAQSHTFQLYTLEVTPSPPWHPGQSLSLLWVPSATQIGPGEPPRSVTCHFWLYGPYSTRAEAQAVGPEPENGGTLAASAPPLSLSTDLSAPAPSPVAYALPDALAPGYYVAVGFADAGSAGGASVSWVAEVAA
jgi:hypothetical protein